MQYITWTLSLKVAHFIIFLSGKKCFTNVDRDSTPLKSLIPGEKGFLLALVVKGFLGPHPWADGGTVPLYSRGSLFFLPVCGNAPRRRMPPMMAFARVKPGTIVLWLDSTSGVLSWDNLCAYFESSTFVIFWTSDLSKMQVWCTFPQFLVTFKIYSRLLSVVWLVPRDLASASLQSHLAPCVDSTARSQIFSLLAFRYTAPCAWKAFSFLCLAHSDVSMKILVSCHFLSSTLYGCITLRPPSVWRIPYFYSTLRTPLLMLLRRLMGVHLCFVSPRRLNYWTSETYLCIPSAPYLA